MSRGAYASLNLSHEVGDQESAVQQNLEQVKLALRVPVLVTLRQTHSDLVLPVFYSRTPADLLEGDAAFTGLTGIGLGVRVADCLPVFVYSLNPAAVGVAHCGWRGTVSRIAEKLVRQMSRRFSVPLTDLSFALGPCICPGCYTVGEDVVSELREHFPAPEKFFSPGLPPRIVQSTNVTPNGVKRSGRVSPKRESVKSAKSADRKPGYRLDIRAANRWLLKQMGLRETGSLDLCTRENAEQFYSARTGHPTGRNLALIAIT